MERIDELPKYKHNERVQNIVFDIETTGLCPKEGDEVTVVGLNPDRARPLMLVQDEVDGLGERLGDDDVALYEVDSEKELLEALREIRDEIKLKEQRFVAYNGETFRDGFDLPFLRTRCIMQDVDWVFKNAYYVDVYPSVRKRLSTEEKTIDALDDEHTQLIKESSTEVSQEDLEEFSDKHDVSITKTDDTLDGVHEDFCGCGIDDPFESSKEAVTKWENGNAAAVVHHCYTDILRTQCVFEIVLEYITDQPKHMEYTTYL